MTVKGTCEKEPFFSGHFCQECPEEVALQIDQQDSQAHAKSQHVVAFTHVGTVCASCAWERFQGFVSCDISDDKSINKSFISNMVRGCGSAAQ